MKYIIVSKNIYEGTWSSDKADPLYVTEICSELIITRLHLINMLKSGEVTIDDTVVTTDERLCLYTKIFKNVITFKEFLQTKLSENDSVVDLLVASTYDHLAVGGGIPYKPFYQNYERDKEEISNIDWSDMSEYDLSKPFSAILIRRRGAWPEKNMTDEYWTALIEKLNQSGARIFIFGRETEQFTNGKNIKYVKNFRDWCTLVAHPNCKHITSTMTGGVYPALIFGAQHMKMFIIDNTNLMEGHAHDPSFYNDCINFSKVKIEFSKTIPSIEELYDKVTDRIQLNMNTQNELDTYNYIIIGAGVTGVAAARRLQQLGEENVLVLEGEQKYGGLCRTEYINGHYLDLGGGHVLHSRFPEVLDWIFEHIPIENFNKFNTKVLIDLEGHPVEFPIELNLWQLPVDMQVEYLYSYLNAAGKDIKYENFESWIKNYLGDKIAENYMIPYNKKLWCIDISKLNTDWLIKIPDTDIKLVLRSIIEKNSQFTEKVVSHKSFYYPKEGGFQTVIDSIKAPVSEKIKTNFEVKTLRYDKENELWIINETYKTKKVINTAPWPKLDIQIDGFDYKKEFENLEYLSDVISLWEREPYTHGAHWMYIPSDRVEQHREFYIHNFAPHSKPGGVMTDINRKRWLEMDKKWKAGTPLYEHENIWSYPLPTKIYKESMKKILNFSKDYNLFGLGRWGQWQYYNTDQCIKQVLEFFKDEKGFDYYKTF